MYYERPAPCKGTMHIIHPQVPSGDAYCATQKCNATAETADLKYETDVTSFLYYHIRSVGAP